MSALRPRYYYFVGYSKAKEFADRLNSRARVNKWLVRASVGLGYTVYNIRRIENANGTAVENSRDTLSDW